MIVIKSTNFIVECGVRCSEWSGSRVSLKKNRHCGVSRFNGHVLQSGFPPTKRSNDSRENVPKVFNRRFATRSSVCMGVLDPFCLLISLAQIVRLAAEKRGPVRVTRAEQKHAIESFSATGLARDGPVTHRSATASSSIWGRADGRASEEVGGGKV